MRTRAPRTVLSIDGAKDYTLVEGVLDDLMLGQLDLDGAGVRIREIYDAAFKAGAVAYAETVADQTAKLAAENRQLRQRLVQQSLVRSAVAS